MLSPQTVTSFRTTLKRSHRVLLLCFALAFSLLSLSETPQKRLKVGLVLGGGGAKGAAEVGVLKVIEQLGIPIDYIAGTSIGSIVGGLYAVGYRSDRLDTLFCSQDWAVLLADRDVRLRDRVLTERDGVTYIFGFPVSRKNSKHADPAFGMVKGDHIMHSLDSLTFNMRDPIHFDSLPIPFRCVATAFPSQKEIVLSKGNFARSMRASMAIPGVFKPVKMGNEWLFDGGMMNNLPVDVVKAMGADLVIAVDLSQNEQTPRDEYLKDLGIGGMIGWVVARPDIDKYMANCQIADVIIRPDLGGYGVTSFSQASMKAMIRLGEQAAIRQKSALLQLKQRIFGTQPIEQPSH
ncbi:MAG: patatin-like phospholipase family protein [Prevotella sp.]|nr:patatin-like phospholipase family protein [Prevotella sp.]